MVLTLMRNGEKLVDNQITDWHVKHMTASYHCIVCGNELTDKYECYGCKKRIKVIKRRRTIKCG